MSHVVRSSVSGGLRAALVGVFALALAPSALAAPFAYVPSVNTNTVSVIDLATRTIVATIPVGRAPNGVAANPTGTAVYVLNAMDNTVSAIDAASRSVVATIAVGNSGGAGSGIAMSADGARVYVANALDNTLSVIDTSANAVVGSPIAVGQRPIGIAVDAFGGYAYVANADSQSLSIVDLGINAAIADVPLGAAANGVAVDPSTTRVYVTTAGGVAVVDLSSRTVLATIPFADAYGVAVSPDGAHAYATSRTGASLFTIDTAAGTPTGPPLDLGAAACGVSVTLDGATIDVVMCGSDSMSIVSAATQTVSGTIAVPSGPVALGRFLTDLPPTAVAQSVAAAPNAATPIVLSGVDGDGDPLTFAIVDAPAHGTLTGTPPSMSYTPVSGYAGADSFTFKVNDGAVDSSSALVSIAVPSATSTAIASTASTTTYGQPITLAATVSSAAGAPTGSVRFLDGSVVLGSSTLINGVASLSSSTIGAGSHTISAAYVPSGSFAASSSAPLTLTINKATGTATVTVSVLTPVYSDLETFSATFTPASPGVAPANVTFKVGTQIMGDAALVPNGSVYQASLTRAMIEPTPPTRQMKPDFHTVTAVFTDPNFSVATSAKGITIQAEDARVAYAGPATLTLGTSTTVPLTVAVKDITAVPGDPAWDPYPGDIRNAQVSFIDRSTNMILGTVWVTASDTNPTVGSATFNWPVNLGTAKSKSYTIGFIVGYYYRRNSTADNVTITVSK
jgi:YVTN family beta-propeller protein